MVLNYNSDVAGAKVKRPGYETFLNNPDSLNVYNMIHARLTSGRFVLRVSGTSIYKYAFTGSTWGSAVKTGIGYVANQSQVTGDPAQTDNYMDATTDYLAQGFKVNATASCQYVNVLLKKVGSPGNLTLRIETDTTGSPSGTLVNASATATITAASVGTSVTWITVKFATAFSLTSGTQYHLVIQPSATADGSNYIQWVGTTSNLYADGVLKISTNSGTSYAATASTLDAGFIVYSQTKCRMGSTVLNNLLILGNGGDYTMKYDGVTFTDMTSAPRCPIWLTYKGRAYCFRPDYAKSRGFFSKTFDPTSWTNDPNDVSTGNYFDIDPDFNGDVVGAEVIDDRIIVHKETGSYRIVPDEFGRPAEILPIPTKNVTTSHWAIKEVNGQSIYPARNGAYIHTGVKPSLLSYVVDDLFKGIVGTVRNDLCAGVWNNHYFLSAMGSITGGVMFEPGAISRIYTNAVLVYNSLLNEWYLYSFGHQPTCFETFNDTTDTEYLYFGDSSGNTWKYGVGTLDGTLPIHSELELWPSYVGQPDKQKDITEIAAFHNKGVESEIMFSFDGDEFEPLGDLRGDYSNKLVRDIGGGRRNVSFKVLDSSLTTGSIIYGFSADIYVWGRDEETKSLQI